MKRLTALLPLLFVLFACRNSAGHLSSAPAVLARWHFQGATYLQTQTSAPALAKAASALGSEAIGVRLATNLVRVVLQRLNVADEPQLTPLLAPLANDLLRYESAGEVTAHGWRVTVHLPTERAHAWQAHASSLAILGTQAGAPSLSYANGWLVVSSGTVNGAGSLPIQAGTFFNGEGDLAALLGGAPADWPRFQATAAVASNNVVTHATFDFSKPPLSALPEWQLPEKMAHAPFTQFTAFRGGAPWLQKLAWWNEIFGTQSPEQVFGWSSADGQLCSFWAAPVTDPKGNIERIFSTVSPHFGTNGLLSGRPELATNHEAVAVFNPLGVKPVAAHVRQGSQDFLLAALFPGGRSTNPIPARLRTTLQDPNLVFHDVEFTPESIQHWNAIFQFYQVMKGMPVNARKALAHDWMWNSMTELGDAVTVVHQTSPTRLTLERSSSLGLTGLELVVASRWLDGPIKPLPGGRLSLPVPPAP